LLRAPRAAGARNIYGGFADVTRASGVNLTHNVTQMFHAEWTLNLFSYELFVL
jgi:hypothetical protein